MKARFRFRKGVNTLIGENGSGKTNALYALRLLLDETLARNSLCLRESDFCRSIGQWRGHWIVVSVDFAELDASEGCQLLRHNAGHMDGTNTGTYTFLFRPKHEARKKLHELSGSGEELDKYLDALTVDDYEFALTGRARGASDVGGGGKGSANRFPRASRIAALENDDGADHERREPGRNQKESCSHRAGAIARRAARARHEILHWYVTEAR